MVAIGCKIKKPYNVDENGELVEGETIAQFEIGNPEWVEFIKFAQGKVILKGEDDRGHSKSETIPIGEDNILQTISDGTPVPEKFRAPQRQQQRSRAF